MENQPNIGRNESIINNDIVSNENSNDNDIIK